MKNTARCCPNRFDDLFVLLGTPLLGFSRVVQRFTSAARYRLRSLVPALVLLALPAVSQAVTLNPVADTDNQSDGAAGTNATLNISAYCTPFIKFDLSGVSGTVTNATLRVYFGALPATTITVSTTSNDTWVEGGAKPTIGTTLTTKALGGTSAGYIEFNLTAHAQAKMSGNKIVSVTLNNTLSGWNGLNSRQAASNKPELVITTSGGGPILVTGISVSPASASLQTGAAANLTATVTPGNAANQTLSWTSSNTGVATVNSSGVVTAVAVGSANIVAHSTDGSNVNSNAAAVTVTAPSGGTTTFNPVADTDTQSDGAAGTNANLNISAYCFPLLKFDLSSISGTVTSATLRVYFGGGLPATTLTASATSNDTWVEGGAKPSVGSTITSQSISATGAGYISLNLTSHVQSKMSGNKIVSVALADTTSGWMGLNSRQASSNKPELVVVTSGGGFVPVSSISISPTSATVTPGGTTTVTATVNPAAATNKTLQWQSSNTGAATVNSSGVVTGVAVGQSTITAHSTDGTNITSNGTTITVASGGGQVQRPSYNTGTGFFVVGNKLYDANGYEFRIRGTNDIGFWRGGTDRAQQRQSMKNMKVNAARLVFANWAQDGPSATDTPEWRKSIAQAFIDKQIVPIPAVWFARNGLEITCQSGTDRLSAAVDDWVGPDAAWIKSLERYVILNIANEWGPNNSTVWRDAYITAVQRIRNAGIKATLMIDAGGCGQDRMDLVNFASAVLAADPQKNIVFSVHVYGAYWTSATMAADMAQIAATGICVTVGEFSSQQYNQQVGWNPITPDEVITHAENNGFGWLAWQWYNDSAENIVNGPNNSPQPYPPESNLSVFGVAVKNKLLIAQPATIF